ncbi:MAG TPA: protein kinase [Vicinamibacterales bacterium]|nr:protein kinase [Vicinamibacterales bacterium]
MRPQLGPYHLIEEIGAGGMGVVYRAHDPRLQRDVAIKVLPPGTLADPVARKRFRNEALAISKLNHPGISTVHDVGSDEGTDYLVMELVPGVSLDKKVQGGASSERDVLDLGAQMALALAAAHEQHIIHRDLKPGNLRLTPDGRLKMLDFGLARSLEAATGLTTTAADLESDGVAGTLPYMSPEQLRNEQVDQRTDIWAAGAVLYELATGTRPFGATSAVALAGDILHKPPTTPRALRGDLSPGLESIVLRCLEKEPGRRYQSARELAAALTALTAGTPSSAMFAARRPRTALVAVALVAAAAGLGVWWALQSRAREARPAIRTVAVMPLQNLSADPDQDYFAEGLTDALVTDLSRIEGLRVLARGSVARYREEGKVPSDLARDLGVDAVVDGTVLREGNQVRISTQLVLAATNTNLWAQSYQRDLKDVLGLQRDVAQAIAEEVRLQIAPEHQQVLARRQPVDPAAYDAYLRGRHFWNKRGLEDLRKAVAYFEEAITRDPTYASAYSGVADAYISLYDYGYLSAADVAAKVRPAARKALELDDSLAEAHNSLAHLALHDWEWDLAEAEFKRAIALDRGYVPAYHWYALCLTAIGRTDDAIAVMQQARELDPLSLRINADLGMALLAGKRYDEAIAQEEKTLELDPNFRVAYWIRGMAYQQKHLVDEAEASYREALKRSPGNPNYLAALGNLYGAAGRKADAHAILDQMHALNQKRAVSPFFFALVYAGLGAKEEALAWLERSYQERSGSIRYLKVEPRLDNVRSEPRFLELMEKVGLR